MDDKLVKLKIKRYLSQYEYLDSELCETQYLFEQYKTEFYKECPKVVCVNAKKDGTGADTSAAASASATGFICDDPAAGEDEGGKTETKVDKVLQRLYKKLCLKTHPDKLNGDNTHFQEVRDAYNHKDVLKLLLLSKQYNLDDADIDKGACCAEEFLLFENTIKDMNEKISNIKTTLAWNWAFADDAQKVAYKHAFKF